MKRTFSTFSPLCAKDIYRPNVCTIHDSVGNGLCHVCPFHLFIYLFIITHVIFQQIWNSWSSCDAPCFFIWLQSYRFVWNQTAQIKLTHQPTNYRINENLDSLLHFLFSRPIFTVGGFCGTEQKKKKIQFQSCLLQAVESSAICFIMNLLKYHSMFIFVFLFMHRTAT